MANRSNDERTVRSLTHTSGGSYLVTLPIEYVKALKWKEKQKLIVELSSDKIVIKDWKK